MELKMVPVDKIHPNPFQPRRNFEEKLLRELAGSMIDANVIQPIVIRPMDGVFQIIAGERRWRAAKIAGLREVPCLVREIAEERVLLDSIIENLHRKDLTDIERENAIHELWSSKRFKSMAELARRIGVPESRVRTDVEAWEFRHRESLHEDISTRTIRGTRSLPVGERKRVIQKVSSGDFRVSDVDKVASILKRAPEPIRNELLKPKSFVTPQVAEILVEKLPTEEEQGMVLEEVRKHRLREDEVEDRVREIKRARETGKPLTKEMGVRESTFYTVGEYECPHCGKHYLIKCNGKRDWVE